MSWIDKYFAGPLILYAAGVALAPLPGLNFGSGFTVTQNAASGYYTVTASGGGIGLGTAGQLLVTNSGASATAWVSMSGDATMTAAGVVTVGSIHGASVPAAGSLTTGYTLQVTGPSSLGYGPVTPTPSVMVALSATGTINPQVDTSYAVDTTSGPVAVTLASTVPDGTKLTFYDATQKWPTHNLTITDAGGFKFRVPWNISGADVTTLTMGGAGDSIAGQSVTIQRCAVGGLDKWLC
jgi:hypothetical protein